jgi:two-component system nitrate/nitrite response regulator NarL
MTTTAAGQNPRVPSDTGRAVRVVLADDEPMFRASLRQLLTAPPSVIKDVYGIEVGAGFDVIGEAGNGHDTIAAVRSARPELLLLDLGMPGLSGLDALREVRQACATMRTIVLSGRITQAHLVTAIQLGVRGVVRKDETTELLFEAIMRVMEGQHWLGPSLVTDLMEMVRTSAQTPNGSVRQPFGLTPREREVLALVAAGYPNKEIARSCAVSEETIKHHLTRMFDKVGVSNRLELAMLASQVGLLSEPSSAPTAPES